MRERRDSFFLLRFLVFCNFPGNLPVPMGKPRLWYFVKTVSPILHVLGKSIGFILGNRDPNFQVFPFFRWLLANVSIENRSLCSRGRGAGAGVTEYHRVAF